MIDVSSRPGGAIMPGGRLTTRRGVLQAAAAGLAALALPAALRAQEWRRVQALRERIGGAAVSTGGLSIELPLVAEDGSSVPVSIKSDAAAGIRSVELFAPRNPTAEVASFEFGPEIGPLNIATRIRLSESQTVIALARSHDGRLIVAEREVRVTTSGCIAPAAPADGSTDMQVRVRMPKNWKAGAPGEVLTMINHPMTTGLAQDGGGATPPQRIIDAFEATLDGRPLIKAVYHRSLAANPYLRFDVTPRQGGEMRFQWKEDTGRVAEHQAKVSLA